MAKTYAEIQKQIELLRKTADAVRRKEVAGVVERIRVAIDAYRLTASDLGLERKPAAQPKKQRRAGTKAAALPRYRDESGRTWSGRGRRPGWFVAALAAGKSADDLRA